MSKAKPEDRFVKLLTENRNAGRFAKIPANGWKVLSAIALYLGRDNISRPSIETLARVTGYSPRQVRQIINGKGTPEKPFPSLAYLGEVEIIEEKNGPYPKHVYKIRPGLFRYGMNANEWEAKKHFDEFKKKLQAQPAEGTMEGLLAQYGEKYSEPREVITSAGHFVRGPDGFLHKQPAPKMKPYEEG